MARQRERTQGLRVRQVTRARLLAAAEEIFLAAGFTASSVDAIAAAAGYTTGAVYSNFGGKADLFLAVLEQATLGDFTVLTEALGDAKSDEQRLAVFTSAIVQDPARWQARVVATMEFLSYARQHPELRPRIVAAQRVADDGAAQLVAALCRALGVEPPSAIDEAAREVMALINGLTLRSLFDDDFDIASAVASAVNALLTGERESLRELVTPRPRRRVGTRRG